jgi:peptidoglycan/LPS O-acetylase OafA/YrhL
MVDALAALTVSIGAGLMTGAVQSLLTKASAYIARYSYEVYLFDLPPMAWLLYRPLAPWRVALLTVLAIALPVIAYHAVEAPLISAGARLGA